jgi:hypothetical protein
VGPTLLNCANNQLPHVILCLCFGLVINCHVAFCCRGANRLMPRGFPFSALCTTIVTSVLTWHYPEVATWTVMVRWPYGWGATWHLWGPHPIEILPCGTHTVDVDKWQDDTWHYSADLAHSHVATCYVSSLFWFRVCMLLVSILYPGSYCPQVAPRVILIKSQPLINPYNLFYFLWIYSNSFTYPKIMKISPKIPKFMMIIPVIFNSIFTPVSLN